MTTASSASVAKTVHGGQTAFPRMRAGCMALAGLMASVVVLSATSASAQTASSGMSSDVAQQIEAIIKDKRQLTDTQKKIDPALLYAARTASGQPQLPNAPQVKLPQLSGPSAPDAAGQVVVDIVTNGSGVAEIVQTLGGAVISSVPQYNAIRAKLPVTAIETLAASPAVKNIKTAEEPHTNKIDPPPGFDKRSATVREKLSDALQANVGTGPNKSEAIVAHGADTVQNAGVTGAGVKICVMSNGISTLAARQSAGEIPAVQILSTGQSGSSGDEGTAMLELVADMAPGATLGWSTANSTKAQFAQNILDLRNNMACDIIVDDISYFSEAAFQEDIVANAVTTVVNSGAMFFSSAANSGHLTGGQSGTWEGDFVDGGAVSGPIATAGETGNFHKFGSALFDTLTASTANISLKWSDPLGGSGNDYDLFVLDSTGSTLLGFSAAVQNGTQDPFELAQCTASGCPTSNGSKVFPVNAQVYVVRFSGVSRALRVDTHRGRLSINTSGSTYGHNGGVKTISVAAISNNFQPINRRFLASDVTATYSSDGPRWLFLNPTPATTPITANCYLFACGGTSIPKVDIAAADCDTTTTPGFIPFCGTSAAAPNAAAIAALVKSASPSLTGPQILARMKSTAIDIMAAGVDRDSGYGIVMADTAVNGTVASAKAHDFNGDGKSDILWRDTTGAIAMWLMNGASATTVASLGNGGASWNPVGQRDFNGDGKSDILWLDTSGNVAMWLMNGTSAISTASLGNIGVNWNVASTADFNGDGKGDILWRNTDGSVAMWLMNGTSATSVVSLGNVATNWSIVATADFNGDGKSDILWRNTDGNNVIWLMNGTTVSSVTAIGGVATNWSVVGTADFNGDGRGDILWRNTDGSNAIWLMNGTTVSSVALIGGVATNWSVASNGDYNGDGKGDILWRNTDGNNVLWLMNGVSAASVVSFSSVSNAWTIQNAGAN